MSSNIEALSQNEEGTHVGRCYISSGGSSAWHIECDSRTSESIIYPCPNRERYFSGVSHYCTAQ